MQSSWWHPNQPNDYTGRRRSKTLTLWCELTHGARTANYHDARQEPRKPGQTGRGTPTNPSTILSHPSPPARHDTSASYTHTPGGNGPRMGRFRHLAWPIISCTSAMMAYPTPCPPRAILAAHGILIIRGPLCNARDQGYQGRREGISCRPFPSMMCLMVTHHLNTFVL